MTTHRIALIPGDGIGKEVVPEGVRVLEAAGARHGATFDWTEFDWGCERYAKTGRLMPEDGLETLKGFDAIYLGAVGYPGVPDHVSLWGLLIPIRRTFGPCGCSTACPARSPGARRATSTIGSCARTARGNIRRSGGGSTAARTPKWRCRRPCSPAVGSTGSCATPSSWPAHGPASA